MAVQLTHQRLSNGIQSLSEASPDYELAPVGIASMHDQAQKLAEAGRNGDIYVIHAAEGETVIPMEVLAANPQIKQLLFAQMKDMGLDPQEFVVGNELNSINPVTGLPEFFFKSIFRSVKKAVKKVFKFAKKIAPIAIPLAIGTFGLPFLGGTTLGTIFGPGTAASVALGSGLGSLAGGGSLKDAFKSALISGGITTLAGGLTRGFGAKEGQFGTEFMKGARQTLTGTDAPLGEYIQRGKDYLLGDKPIEVVSIDGKVGGVAKAGPEVTQLAQTNLGDGSIHPSLRGETYGGIRQSFGGRVGVLDPQRGAALSSAAPKGGIMETIFPSDVTPGQVLARQGITNPTAQQLELAKLTAAHESPNILQKYGLSIGAGGFAAQQAGLFDTPVEDEVTTADLQFGTDLSGPNPIYAKDPKSFHIPVNPREFEENILKGQDVFQPSRFAFAADGGMINGPGTGTSDSIPGWLSDGEFVFTERAVRGADPTGQGRRQAGANNMYNIMRNFEMSA